MVTVVSLVCYV